MPIDITIPSLGESVSQGVITRWLKQSGDLVAVDELLFELETEKAAMEIPAEAAGRLEILVEGGSEVSVGTVVGRIVEDGSAKTAPARGAAAHPAAPGPAASRSAPAPAATEAAPVTAASPGRGEAAPLSPAVRKLLAEHGLDAAAIAGSGKGGRITKADVLEHLAKRPAEAPRRPEPEAPARPAVTSPAPQGDTERVPMTLLRRRIAERLVEAQRTAAILTTFNEIDMSAVLELRRRHKARFREVHGTTLGFMSLFGRAVVLALRDVPVVNAQIDGAEIVYFKQVHLGIAVGTERGLVVPVVRGADRMTLAELERAIGELAELARTGKLLPDHLAGGTFTISNGGVYGSLLSTPILNPPQSGILGMHKIEERPVVVDGQVVVRPMMYVALSYDHRLVDGEQAVTFLVRVKERLEDPTRLLLDL
jgi:2-oxoglutarate dehydrogenase E2 component (dihydrolipoamide succinyltransferase)